MEILDLLFSLKDEKYRDFSASLMPTIDKAGVIGVRIPQLRKLAKELKGTNTAESFLKTLPHKYYEENNLHAFLISEIKDFEECVGAVDDFLPYIDNWATCDSLRPKAFRKSPEKLEKYIEKWLESEEIYVKRFGIGAVMTYFLDEKFDKKKLQRVAEIRSGEYYINMMIAWLFATALAKQWDSAFPFIKERRLSVWTHNKTIQKAIESFRITDSQKQVLRKLKIK